MQRSLVLASIKAAQQHTTTSSIDIPPKGGGDTKQLHVLHMRLTNFVPHMIEDKQYAGGGGVLLAQAVPKSVQVHART